MDRTGTGFLMLIVKECILVIEKLSVLDKVNSSEFGTSTKLPLWSTWHRSNANTVGILNVARFKSAYCFFVKPIDITAQRV